MNKINLFCLPFAGGSKYSYKGFSKYIPHYLNLIPIEIPGRGSRFKEDLLRNIHLIVDDIFLQIKDQLNDQYAIYGHSMGTLLSFLLTKKIIEHGLPQPMHLFLSGSGAPKERESEIKRYLLPKEEFILKIKELGGSPDEILNDDSMMSFFEPILRADFEAVETYVYQESAPLNIPIEVFIGTEEKVTYEEAKAWQRESTSEVEVRQFPGKHFFIFNYEKEIMDIMLRKLKKLIITI